MKLSDLKHGQKVRARFGSDGWTETRWDPWQEMTVELRDGYLVFVQPPNERHGLSWETECLPGNYRGKGHFKVGKSHVEVEGLEG